MLTMRYLLKNNLVNLKRIINCYDSSLLLHFSTKKSTGRKTIGKSRSGSIKAPPAPAPSDLVTANDIANAWIDVVDKSSGKTYYWNTITNETTALGAPKPTDNNSSLAHPAPQQQSESLGSVMAQGTFVAIYVVVISILNKNIMNRICFRSRFLYCPRSSRLYVWRRKFSQ